MKQKGVHELKKKAYVWAFLGNNKWATLWDMIIEIQAVKLISYFRKQIDDAYDRRESNKNTYGNCFYV